MSTQDERPVSPGPLTAAFEVMATLRRLVSGEISLARAEVAEAGKRAAVGAVLAGVALVLALAAVMALTGAMVAAAMALGLSLPVAALVVAVFLAAAAVLLVRSALMRLAPSNFVPRRSLAGLQRILETIRAEVTSHGTDANVAAPSAQHPRD